MFFRISVRIDRTQAMSQNHFISLAEKSILPPRRDPGYTDALRTLHSAILGLCALIESVPYSVETWMPPLTEGEYLYILLETFSKLFAVLATHATDPPPISTTIRKCASEFKKVC
jgi:proteasome activator subunit 4